MSISGRILKKIVGALTEAFPTREKLVMMLEFELSIAESYVPNASDYQIVVYQLVKKLDSEGKIIDLIEGAYRFNDGNHDLLLIKQKVIPIIKLYQILALLEKDFIEQIKIAYKACCPEDWHLDGENSFPNNIQQVLDNLEDMPLGNNDYNQIALFLARFLENTGSKLPVAEFQKLNKWGEQHVSYFSQLLAKTNLETKERQDKQKYISSYFLVWLQPSKQFKGRYIVSTWFIADGSGIDYRSGEGYLQVTTEELNEEQKVFSLKEIPSLLQSLLIQISEQPTLSRLQTTLEFFLPHELLNEPIDGWEIQYDEDDFPCPIGSEYKLAIRSSKRLAKYLYKNDWMHKWELLQQQNCSECFVPADSCSWQELYSKLNHNRVYALKLINSPSPEIFQVISKTAVPVALWIRQELENLDIQAELDDLLQCSITELPQRVREKRNDSFGKDKQSHIGHHISFLWENPNILPPQIEYTLPS